MPIFRYRAKDKTGAQIQGRVEAGSLELAENALKERKLQVVLLEEARPKFEFTFGQHIGARDFVIFARQLAVLVGANVPLTQSLRTVVRQTENPNFRKILQKITDEVEAGARFSLALSKYPRLFSDFFVNMIKSGETAGRLHEVLDYLADQQEKEYDLNSKIRGAMIYPAFIIVGIVIVSTMLLIFVIPQLTAVLEESGQALPLTTRMLIGASVGVRKYGWLLAVALAGLILALRYSLRTKNFREMWDKTKLRLPIFGSLFQRIYLTRMTQSLYTLLVGGVDVVTSLGVVGGAVGNAYYKRLVQATAREVEDGNSIITVFQQSPLMPAMVSQMLSVGEETGQMAPVLSRLSSFYIREVENSVANLISIIEPLLMVAIGLGVGAIVAAIILPMYQLAGAF